MNFKFVAKNRETGKTGSLTVKATSEQSARRRLELSGFEVLRLVRSTALESPKLEYQRSARAVRLAESTRAVRQVSKATRMRFRLRAVVADYFPRFALLF